MANHPLRIAVLTGSRGFHRGERDLLERIASDARFELAAWIRTAAPQDRPLDSANNRGGALSASLFSLLTAFEERFIAREAVAASWHLPANLARAETIEFDADCRSAFEHDRQRIRSLDLDVILDLGAGPKTGTLAEAARFGVWSLTYSDLRALRGDPPGFWEVYLRRGVTGATLRKLAADPDGARTIATALYPTRMTYTSNIRFVREQAVELVWRELGKLHRARGLPPLRSADDASPLYVPPNSFQILRYGALLGAAMFKAAMKRIAGKLGVATDRWSLFVGAGAYENAPWSEAVETRPPRGEYWADPFLFRRRGDPSVYVFFEVFDYAVDRGKIAVGRVCDRKIAYLGDVLDTPYHLSYPFVFEYGDRVWMLPETHQMRRLELWRCTEYPFKWKLEKILLDGKDVVDSSILLHDGKWWLFTNQSSQSPGNHNSELHVYQIDSPMMNEIIPHASNPVVIDATRARNGGRIHLKNGFPMRPAQNNSFRYGYGLSVQRIKKLALDAYEEEQVFSVEPTFRPDISACHHLDADNDIFIFDARRQFG